MNKRNYSLLYSIISLIVVFGLGILVKGKSNGILFDVIIMDFISSSRTVNGKLFMNLITFFGSSHFFIIMLLGLTFYFIYKMKRVEAWLVINSIVLAYVTNAILKKIFVRTRPLTYMIIEQSGYSFPSGHSMVSMSFYITMGYIISKRMKNLVYKKIIYVVSLLIVFLIGYSRLYLGVHWPTDVIAGFLMGFLVFLVGKDIIEDRGKI